MKLFIMLMLLPVFASANSLNLSIPQSPAEYSSDRFRAGDLDCSNAITGATKLEFGVTGILGENTDSLNSADNITFGGGDFRDVGVYGRIVIPIGAPKERVNCNTLYQLELTKKRLEVEQLKLQIENLKKGSEGLEFYE